jgi:hypothetical protein
VLTVDWARMNFLDARVFVLFSRKTFHSHAFLSTECGPSVLFWLLTVQADAHKVLLHNTCLLRMRPLACLQLRDIPCPIFLNLVSWGNFIEVTSLRLLAPTLQQRHHQSSQRSGNRLIHTPLTRSTNVCLALHNVRVRA